MRILITGGAGYVGSLLTRTLVEYHDVFVIDTGVFGLDALDKRAKLLNYCDSYDTILQLLRTNKIEAVIHLAGISTDCTSQVNPRVTDLVNHILTANIAKACKLNGTKMIFASSASVYFNYDQPLVPPLNKESDPINAMSAYALSKRSAELSILELTNDRYFEFNPIIFRCGTVFGVSPRMRLDLVLNSFMKNGIFHGVIDVNCNGVIYRPIIDIDDLVRVYIWALTNDVPGHILNVNSYNFDVLILANRVQQFLSHKGHGTAIFIHPTGIARNYLADNELLLKLTKLDITPLDNSLEKLYHAIKQIKDLDNIKYYNDKVYASR